MKTKFDFFQPSDIEFLMRALVISLLIMALLHSFKPYLGDSVAADRAAVEDLARQSRFMTPGEVTGYLKQSARPTMLVVYASWCQYCKMVMPSLRDLWSEGTLPGDQMLVVSLDTQLNPLAEYLLANRLDPMIGVPVILKANETSALRKALRPLGSSFTGGIPYIGFFDKGGQLLDEVHGAVDKNELERALVKLK